MEKYFEFTFYFSFTLIKALKELEELEKQIYILL